MKLQAGGQVILEEVFDEFYGQFVLLDIQQRSIFFDVD